MPSRKSNKKSAIKRDVGSAERFEFDFLVCTRVLSIYYKLTEFGLDARAYVYLFIYEVLRTQIA